MHVLSQHRRGNCIPSSWQLWTQVLCKSSILLLKNSFFFLLNSTTEHLSSTKNLFLFKNTICSVFIIWHACICTDHMVLDNRFRILPQGRPFLPLSHAQLSLLAYSSLSRIRAHRLAISTLASTGAALVQVLFRRPCSMRLHEIELLWYF